MDRRSLLQGLLAMPIAGAVNACGDQPYTTNLDSPQGRAATLKVVIDGPFAIVVQKNNRSRVRVFTPKDPDNLHRFFFLEGSESGRALEPREANRRYNFELPTDGLKMSPQEVQFDATLGSFNVRTDLWCQEDFPLTIDLPRPRRISGLLPPIPVTFKNTGKQGCMPIVHVLEYDVTDISKVKITWDGGKDLHVTPAADLMKRYEDACREHDREHDRDNDREHDKEKAHASDPGQEHATPSCPERSKQLASYFSKADVVFFFGTGVPGGTKDLSHALSFFNEQILKKSFPHLVNQLELSAIRPREACRSQDASSHLEAPDAEQSGLSLTEAAYYPDCSNGGLVAGVPF